MTNTSVDKIWNAVKKIKRTTSFDNTQQNCNKEKNPDSEEGIREPVKKKVWKIPHLSLVISGIGSSHNIEVEP